MALIYHDGIVIPTLTPKGPNDDEWFGFDFSLLDNDAIISSDWMINWTEVASQGDAVDGLVYGGKSNDTRKTRVRISGGVVGNEYLITNVYSTSRIPTQLRSFKLIIARL